MPRTVRNFWVEVEIDGQKTVLKGGPKAKDGGLRIKLYMRAAGAAGKVQDVLDVSAYAIGDVLCIDSIARDSAGHWSTLQRKRGAR